jgi:antitoxin component of RelBE/YafQ-DinJ toxin-antitoxin module
VLEKVTIRVDKKEWEEFKKNTANKGFSASSVIRNFIKEYIKQEKNKKMS